MKKILVLFLAAALLFSFCACNTTGESDVTTADGAENTENAESEKAEKTSYTVRITTLGGRAVSGQKVYVYKNGDDLTAYGITDANGEVGFKMEKSDAYTLKLDPKGLEGYDTQPKSLTGEHTEIVLDTVLRAPETLGENDIYALGTVVHDFVFTDTDGKEHKISEILEEKNVLILNFWYINCTFCVKEFPYFESAYAKYRENAELIALDPYVSDTEAKIRSFKESNGLTFPMVRDTSGISSALNVKDFPTTVVIDRYGVICLITGTVTEESQLETVFDYFTGESYEQKLFKSINDIPTGN